MPRVETTYIALLRGINVTGANLLPMKQLVEICAALGFLQVRTYIQSGNVVFRSKLTEEAARTEFEGALEKRMAKRIAVMLRTAEELAAVFLRNPFPEHEPAKVGVHFLHDAPATNFLERVIAPGGEQVRVGLREVYVYFPEGMGRTKLKLPIKPDAVTVRNINTVAKLVEMSRAAEGG